MSTCTPATPTSTTSVAAGAHQATADLDAFTAATSPKGGAVVADAGADADLDGHGPGDAQAGARAGKSGGDKNGFKFKFQEAKAKHGDHATAESGADAEQVKGGAMVGYDEAPRKHEAGQRTGTGTLWDDFVGGVDAKAHGGSCF